MLLLNDKGVDQPRDQQSFSFNLWLEYYQDVVAPTGFSRLRPQGCGMLIINIHTLDWRRVDIISYVFNTGAFKWHIVLNSLE